MSFTGSVAAAHMTDPQQEDLAGHGSKFLNAAKVDFAILGEEERCTCESARRLGNEYLYQTATQEIIETLKRYRFKRVLVTCPTVSIRLPNEYPLFGIEFPVIHHTQLIQELIECGKLSLKPAAQSVVFSLIRAIWAGTTPYSMRRAGCSSRRAATWRPVPREREKGFLLRAGGGPDVARGGISESHQLDARARTARNRQRNHCGGVSVLYHDAD